MHHPQTSKAKCWKPIRSLVIYITYKPSMEETEEREAAALLRSLSPSLSLSPSWNALPTYPPTLWKEWGNTAAYLESASSSSSPGNTHTSQVGVEVEMGCKISWKRNCNTSCYRSSRFQGLRIPFSVILYKHVLVLQCQITSPTEIRKDASVSCKWIRKDKSGVFCLAVWIFASCYQEVLRCFFFFLL